MCDVTEVKNGWEVTCNNRKRLIMSSVGIIIEGCILSYAAVGDDCPKLPSGVHVAFAKESNGSMAKAKLEDEYCHKCEFAESIKFRKNKKEETDMFNSTRSVFSVLGRVFLVILTFAQASWACGPGAENCSQDRLDKKQSVVMQSVDPIYVCMINDSVMKKPQIPVMINGKTYYGCCNGCVAQLKEDAASRYSSDPTTGRSVDKANAYIAKDRAGKALYFESVESYKAYVEKERR